MDEIKAGVTLMTKFCKPVAAAFKGYVDYIDREEAQRAKHTAKYNLYQDYMGNPRKTGAIFTASFDELSPDQLATLKLAFQQAQDKGSMMWQTVISFDNRWLEKNHLYDSKTGVLDDQKLRNSARTAIRKMLKNEDMEDALWSGAIHYNTDNIHIHIAIVDPNLVRQQKEYIYHREDGSVYKKKEFRGKFKLRTLEMGKSAVIGSILNDKENNRLINDIIRKSILDQKKQVLLSEDQKLREAFFEIYQSLPDNMSLWNYNSNIMAPLRPKLDQLTDAYIQTYHAEEYLSLIQLLSEQNAAYREAYGDSKSETAYIDGKIRDIHTRMGNAILKEMREYRKNSSGSTTGADAGNSGNDWNSGRKSGSNNRHLYKYLHRFTGSVVPSIQDFNKAYYQFRKTCRKTWEEILNEQQYERMQDEVISADVQNHHTRKGDMETYS